MHASAHQQARPCWALTAPSAHHLSANCWRRRGLQVSQHRFAFFTAAAAPSQQASTIPESLNASSSNSSSSSGSTPSSSNGASGSVRVFYHTAWNSARLHGSVQGGPWRDYPLAKVASAPGKWLVTDIKLRADGANGSTPAVEFVVAGQGDSWDKPFGGGNYSISTTGTYALKSGAVNKVTGPPVLIVSDLDGTMVGDDNASAAFKAFWEDVGVLRGGMLVYNTGRSLESFKQLMQAKAGCLAHPDVLISAVGTKVYNFSNGSWVEDAKWRARLDEGWVVGAVRNAAYSALAMVGRERMHFRPPEEQNDHKVTCGVHVEILQTVLDHIQLSLEQAKVTANIITSGTGDWRFLDLVPVKAGKLEALEYVRRQHGFPLSGTVACGDSGNDILMLSGSNLAIVVANAQPDLVKWLEERLDEGEQSPLQGVPRLLHAKQKEAYGILEGLEAFGYK